ncbi:MAG: sporulation initiation factor Spo0A C-terminal domain-containing protein [Lachnospiraceae bacterium]|nr:sporulation initiation factor Spo0A C-terminal domain-containing protein [Lachnospiraceae bacterium]
MKNPNYTTCTISMREVQQLLRQNNQPVFLVLYRPDQSDEPKMLSASEEFASFRPADRTDIEFRFGDAGKCEFRSDGAGNNDPYSGNVGKCEGSGDLMRERLLADYLHSLGIPAHLKGYEYLKRGVEIAMNDPSALCAITKELYPDIARSCGSSSVCVERAIRHAIENAWNRGNLLLRNDLFGTADGNITGRPTNGEFIAMVAEKLRLAETNLQ